jgi:hypothetical protein
MQVPILNGIYADTSPDVRTAYPVNLVPVPKESGVSAGLLRPADGINAFATGTGNDRGGIEWRGACYRVSGTRLIRVNANGSVDNLADLAVVGGADGQVTLDYSFDRLGIASNGRLYYWNGTTLAQVTDPDLGTVVDMVWLDGYFVTTDGSFIVVTELNDPFAVNPLKFGSSEVDPDPILGLLRLKGELYALNRNTIEVFDNIGGDLFPFQRIDGAQIQKGIMGTHSACVFADAIAFLGSGRNEPASVYIGSNSNALKIATREIDEILLTYTDAELSAAVVEARMDRGHQHLWIHLPDRVLVYDLAASQAVEEPVWFVLTDSMTGYGTYPGRNLVWCYDRWIVGDPASSRIGAFVRDVSTLYSTDTRWEFASMIMYNDGRGAILNELELVALTGSVAPNAEPSIATSYSEDGILWSVPRRISAGRRGQRAKRLAWLQQGPLRSWRIQRFQGDTSAHLSFMRLEAQIEPLAA